MPRTKVTYIKTQSHAISLIRAEDSGLSQNGPVVIASPPRLGTIITAHNHRTWAVRCKEVRTPGSHNQSLSSSNDLDRVINARVFTVTCPAPWCHLTSRQPSPVIAASRHASCAAPLFFPYGLCSSRVSNHAVAFPQHR